MMSKHSCSGCGICAAVCPVQCIRLEENGEGFLEAVTDASACTKCGLCDRVCAFAGKPDLKEPAEGCFYVTKDKASLEKSASGGLCYDLAVQAVRDGGTACGAVYDADTRRTAHRTARTEEELDAFRDSKYMQSRTAEAVRELLKSRDSGILIGTPCQVYAVRQALKAMKRENLLLVDFACHGTPPLPLWDRYLDEWETASGEKAERVRFRHKREDGPSTDNCMMIEGGGKRTVSPRSGGDTFYACFLSNLCLNLPCYQDCPFHSTQSAADIRCADSQRYHPFGETGGTSIALTYTEQGRAALNALEDRAEILRDTTERVYAGQLKRSLRVPKQRTALLAALRAGKPLEEIRRSIVIPYQKRQLWVRRFRKIIRLLKGSEV